MKTIKYSILFPRNKADIPNIEGFMLRVIMKSGVTVRAVVAKNQETGMHYLQERNGQRIRFSLVKGWLAENE